MDDSRPLSGRQPRKGGEYDLQRLLNIKACRAGLELFRQGFPLQQIHHHHIGGTECIFGGKTSPISYYVRMLQIQQGFHPLLKLKE